MTESNLSKIKTKLRTCGGVTGNFGKNKVKAGSPLSSIGVTNTQNIHITTPRVYLRKLYLALDTTQDMKLKEFLVAEIRKIHIQRNVW